MAKDPTQRQKLQRLWCRRGLLSLGFLCLIGVAVVRVPIVRERQTHYQHAQVELQERALEQEQALEQARAVLEQEQALEQARAALEQEQERMQAMQEQEQAMQALALERAQAVQALEWALEQERALREQVSALERRVTYEFIGLGAVAFGGLVLLLLLVLQRDRTGVPLTGHLVLVLPEECIADLAALHQRLQAQKRPRWFIRLRMVQEILELMFGIYIRINLDNLFLPGWGNRIDDE